MFCDNCGVYCLFMSCYVFGAWVCAYVCVYLVLLNVGCFCSGCVLFVCVVVVVYGVFCPLCYVCSLMCSWNTNILV